MIRSLHFRLLLAFTLVIIIAAGTVSLFVSYSLRSELLQYEQRLLFFEQRFSIV